MTIESPHPEPSLANLVERLVAYLRQKPAPAPGTPLPPPEDLDRVFDSFAHHLVALALTARSDGRIAASERDAIFRHCANRARAKGREMSTAEEIALADYLRRYRPAMDEVGPMLTVLKRDTKDEILDLIGVAHEVIRADGALRLEEVAYLTSLRHDLLALKE
jgi:hypothetical protein